VVTFGRPSRSRDLPHSLVVLSTLTLYDASLVVLRLGGLLDFLKPSWLLLAAAFFVSGPGSWALAASLRPGARRFLAAVAPLGLLGVAYSALLTQVFRQGLEEVTAAGRLAALTLLLMGLMELLLVDDAKRLLNGLTRRCLAGIPLYIYPLLVLFALVIAYHGGPLAYLVYATALLYAARRQPPRGARLRCTATAVPLLLATLGYAVTLDPEPAAVSAALATAAALAPWAPLGPLEKPAEADVVDRLVLLGLAAVAAELPLGMDPGRLAEDLAVYAAVAALGWAMTAMVAEAAGQKQAIAAAANSPVLRHAAGFALVLAGLHVLGATADPGLVLLAAATASAIVNTAARTRQVEEGPRLKPLEA
jgi:hypothetical protein